MAGPMMEKLAKWRTVLAGWHNGTRSMEEPGTNAMRDLMDKWLCMRVENNALAGLLIEKGVIALEEYQARIEHEAEWLDASLAKRFPGFKSTPTGLSIDPALAAETMRRLGFPQ